MEKRKRGAQPGNQNARKALHERYRKVYYRINFFGQRWDQQTGREIHQFLNKNHWTQKEYILSCIQRDNIATHLTHTKQHNVKKMQISCENAR
jgi:hypothetical protein